jgi:glycosyltransferase involved in cell wall biosynthesis
MYLFFVSPGNNPVFLNTKVLMRTISSQVSAVISPSRFVMDFHLHHEYFKRTDKHVIPNPSRLFTRSYTPSGGMAEFICIGQLSEIKGFQIAIAAFKMVKERNSRLHIVGEGEYLRALREIAGSDERIIFHGYVNQTELEEIFNGSFSELFFQYGMSLLV